MIRKTIFMISVMCLLVLSSYSAELFIDNSNEEFNIRLAYLLSKGDIAGFDISRSPLSLEELKILSQGASDKHLREYIASWVDAYDKEFGINLITSACLKGNVEATMVNDITLSMPFYYKPYDFVSLYVEPELSVKNFNYTHNQRPWFDYYYFRNKAGYFMLNSKYFKVLVGRSTPAWGNIFMESMLLSGNTGPIDGVYLEFTKDYFSAKHIVLILDPFLSGDTLFYERLISGHRLGLHFENFDIGISEFVLFPFRDFRTLSYLSPINIYYVEQFNSQKDDNMFIDIDFTFSAEGLPMIYGEFFIDDFQFDLESAHEIGGQVGIKYAAPFLNNALLGLEYSIVADAVYGQRKSYNRYLYSNKIIGYADGCDTDRLKFRVDYFPRRPIRLALDCSYKRKGEGRYYNNRGGRVYYTRFPSGTVEKTADIGLELSWNITALFEVVLAGSYSDIRNQGNNEGQDADEIDISLKLENLWRLR